MYIKKATNFIRFCSLTQSFRLPKYVLYLVCVGLFQSIWAQQNNLRLVAGQDASLRPIVTGVPFLGFAPDARASSIADVGVATKPDANSTHWNNAKFAFVPDPTGVSFSYTPWLSSLVGDMYIAYMSGYTQIKDMQTVAFSLRYFNLGDIQLTNEQGANTENVTPRDYSIDLTYARKLNLRSGLGATMRFISSGLSRYYEGGSTGDPAAGFSVDLGYYYTNPETNVFGKKLLSSWGAHLSNIGPKISYGDESNENFMPTNLRLGTQWTYALKEQQSLSFAVDLNKLLVPTPPIYETDDNGNLSRDDSGDLIIAKGKDPNRPVISSLFSSFSDAPDGFSEEVQEVSIATGLQYWYNEIFSVQTGYHHENANKGNRKYFTFGAGFRYNIFGIDFAYLLPTQGRSHPLANTIRFSMYFNFGKQLTKNSDNKSPAVPTPATPSTSTP